MPHVGQRVPNGMNPAVASHFLEVLQGWRILDGLVKHTSGLFLPVVTQITVTRLEDVLHVLHRAPTHHISKCSPLQVQSKHKMRLRVLLGSTVMIQRILNFFISLNFFFFLNPARRVRWPPFNFQLTRNLLVSAESQCFTQKWLLKVKMPNYFPM